MNTNFMSDELATRLSVLFQVESFFCTAIEDIIVFPGIKYLFFQKKACHATRIIIRIASLNNGWHFVCLLNGGTKGAVIVRNVGLC
jgi:hypothetical protein